MSVSISVFTGTIANGLKVPPPSDEVEGEQRKGRGGLSRDPNAKPPRLSQLTSISGAGGGRAVLPPDSSSKKKNKKKRKS